MPTRKNQPKETTNGEQAQVIQSPASPASVPVESPIAHKEMHSAQNSTLIDAYGEAIAIAVIREQLPAAIRQHIGRILTSDKPEDRAQLESILHQLGLVIAADVLRTCLNHACSTGREQFAAIQQKSLSPSLANGSKPA